MSKYVTELQVSTNPQEEIQYQDLNKVFANLNEGINANSIYLWYKRGDCLAITRIQLSFDDVTSLVLKAAGYMKVDKNLNKGAGGDIIYLWYRKMSSENRVPITGVDATTTPSEAAMKMISGWEPLACDLNRGAGGDQVYLWVKRERTTYIKKIVTTINISGNEQLLQDGYIRLDESTNRGTSGIPIFLWYLPTTNQEEAIRDLVVSINDEEFQSYAKQNYKALSQDLNSGAGGQQVFLWYKKDSSTKKPIQSMTMLVGSSAVEPFKNVGVQVICKNLNSGSPSTTELQLAFYQ